MNGVGWSNSFSPTLTVTTCTVPIAMNALVQGTVTPTSISFSWPELTNMTANGNDIPIYYQVDWYNGTWQTLTTLS